MSDTPAMWSGEPDSPPFDYDDADVISIRPDHAADETDLAALDAEDLADDTTEEEEEA